MESGHFLGAHLMFSFCDKYEVLIKFSWPLNTVYCLLEEERKRLKFSVK